jgi:serine/threonine protein kinase
MLNIGEAIMSIVLGERIKIHQYEAIADTITNIPEDHEYEIEPVGESRSGNIIRRVREAAFENPNWVIFKEGKASKIDKEKAGIELWAKIDPEVVPKIYGYEKQSQNASIVIEFLKGKTLKDLVINSTDKYLFSVLEVFTKNVLDYWKKTMEEQEINPTYFKQLNKRISDIYMVHPDFKATGSYIGGVEIMSLDKMIAAASVLDFEIRAPFSVIVHGDFNLDNIIFNEEKRRIYYIDVHRARRADYVQDVSVFLVSNFRLPFFEKEIRNRINNVILNFYKSSKEFAENNRDRTFQARMTAGLIRSYLTSTRFELNEEFARFMYLKAVYLLENIISFSPGQWENFILPEEILVY